MNRDDVLAAQDALGELLGLECVATGSALMYGQGGGGADMDVLVFDPDGVAGDKLRALNYSASAPAEYFDGTEQFLSYKNSFGVNAIVVKSMDVWENYLSATLAVLRLRDLGIVLNKEQRAALFMAVRSEDPLGELDDRAEYNRG